MGLKSTVGAATLFACIIARPASAETATSEAKNSSAPGAQTPPIEMNLAAPTRALEAGARLGVGLPVGGGGVSFDQKDWGWPFWLDVGVRLTQHVSVSGYACWR